MVSQLPAGCGRGTKPALSSSRDTRLSSSLTFSSRYGGAASLCKEEPKALIALVQARKQAFRHIVEPSSIPLLFFRPKETALK